MVLLPHVATHHCSPMASSSFYPNLMDPNSTRLLNKLGQPRGISQLPLLEEKCIVLDIAFVDIFQKHRLGFLQVLTLFIGSFSKMGTLKCWKQSKNSGEWTKTLMYVWKIPRQNVFLIFILCVRRNLLFFFSFCLGYIFIVLFHDMGKMFPDC